MGTAAQEQDRRFRELILYVAAKSEGDRSFGRTKLNKLLFYCDFLAYKTLGEPISGQQYQKLPFGPGPRGLVPMVRDMVEAGECFWHERNHYGLRQSRLMAERDPDLDCFTPREVDLINEVVGQLWGDSATSVSELSHRFIGWKAVELGETIPYETVLVDEPRPLTADEIEWAQGVVEEYLASSENAGSPT